MKIVVRAKVRKVAVHQSRQRQACTRNICQRRFDPLSHISSAEIAARIRAELK